jgi:hypothetical protein
VVILNPSTGQPFGPLTGGFFIRDANGNLVIEPSGLPITEEPEQSDKIGDTEVLAMEVPILVGTHFAKEKLLVQLGMNIGCVLRAKEYQGYFRLEGNSWFEPGTVSWEVEKKENTHAFHRYSFGLNLSTTYRITRKIGLQLSAIRNLSPVYRKSAEGGGPSYLNSFSLGIVCFLTKNQF